MLKKIIASLLVISCMAGLIGCSSASKAATDSPSAESGENHSAGKTLTATEYSVTEIGRRALKTAELSAEDANTLTQIMQNGSWTDGVTECESDCVMNLKGQLTHYHSDSGTLNRYDLAKISVFSSRAPEPDGKSLTLSEEDRAAVNTILQKYITLVSASAD